MPGLTMQQLDNYQEATTASAAARRLIADNVKVTDELFGPIQVSESNQQQQQQQQRNEGINDDDDDDTDIQYAKSLRRHVQLTFSPYAPAKRARVSSSSTTTAVDDGAAAKNKNSNSTEVFSQGTTTTSKPLADTDSNGQPIPRQKTTADEGTLSIHQGAKPGASSTSTTVALLQSVRRRREEIEEEDRLRSTEHEHSKWDCYRIISGHLGWIRTICFDINNEWFATGSNDRTIKIWDFATGKLKLTLTGHISTVRSICISATRPYLFSCGEDKTIKCWDLEQNKVIRTYHGHLSGVYSLCLHPTLDVLCSAGRDCTLRVWDIRTRIQTRVLSGHRDTVNSVISTNVKPHFVSASIDSTIRLWDLVANRCVTTLTNHKKSVRQVVGHPAEFSFASAAADNIKTWALPNGSLMRNLNHHQHQLTQRPDGGDGSKGQQQRMSGNTLVNCLACNHDGVLVSGGDDGTLVVWDYPSGRAIQTLEAQVQPGSLDCESGVHSLKFDESGSRFISGHVDKTIRMYRPE